MSTLEECLRQLMIDDFGSVSKFAEYAELPKTTVYNLLTRGIAGGSFEVVQKIYGVLGLGWNVLKFDSDYDYQELKRKRDERRASYENNYQDVKVFGRIAAGTPIEMECGDFDFPAPRKVMEHHPNAFFLEVEGESMNRVLPNGCYALVDPDRKHDVRDKRAYAVCVNGYDATIKRIHKLNNGFELVPDSTDPTYKPKIFDYGEEGTEVITIIGEVVWYTVPFDFEI